MQNNKEMDNLFEDQIGFNAYRVGNLFRKHLLHSLREYDLTPEQWQILVVLSERSEPINQMELSSLTFKDRHSLSRTIGRMKASGWIEKIDDSDDKRASLVSLSQKSREIIPIIGGKISKHFSPLLDQLPKKDRETFLIICHRLIRIFN